MLLKAVAPSLSLRSRLTRFCITAVLGRSGITSGRRFSKVMLMQSPALARNTRGSTGTPALSLPVLVSRSALRTYSTAVGSCSGALCPPTVKVVPSSSSVTVTCGMLVVRLLNTRVPPLAFSGPPTCWPIPAGSLMLTPWRFSRISLASAATTS
ncbi:hypothetical protein D3C81_1687680 [compost metagenome]